LILFSISKGGRNQSHIFCLVNNYDFKTPTQITNQSQVWWLLPAIPSSQEAESGELWFETNPSKRVGKILPQKTNWGQALVTHT
jgi:hypothetical protein